MKTQGEDQTYTVGASMRNIALFLLIVICYSLALGQKQTTTDPFGLTAFGFKETLESRPLTKPPEEPQQARACGGGVYLREETVTVNNRAKKIKIVIVYFLPNPSTLATFDDGTEKMKRSPAIPVQSQTSLPVGFSSLTFFWPAHLRREQSVLLMRAEKVNDALIERSLDFPAQLDVQEGDSPSIFWTFDRFIPGNNPPQLLGNLISSDPVKFKIVIPREAKKCLEQK